MADAPHSNDRETHVLSVPVGTSARIELGPQVRRRREAAAAYRFIGRCLVAAIKSKTIARHIERRTITAADLAVWVAIAAHANKSGAARPSVTTIADLAGLGRSSVFNSIRRLQAAGLIARSSRGGRVTNAYTLIMAPWKPSKTEVKRTVHAGGRLGKGATVHGGGPHPSTGVDRTRPPAWTRSKTNGVKPSSSSNAAAPPAAAAQLQAIGIADADALSILAMPQAQDAKLLAGVIANAQDGLKAGKIRNPGGWIRRALERGDQLRPALQAAVDDQAQRAKAAEVEAQRERLRSLTPDALDAAIAKSWQRLNELALPVLMAGLCERDPGERRAALLNFPSAVRVVCEVLESKVQACER